MSKYVNKKERESDTYLATVSRHHWSRQITMKIALSASTVAFISSRGRLLIVICLLTVKFRSPPSLLTYFSSLYLSRFSFYINIPIFMIPSFLTWEECFLKVSNFSCEQIKIYLLQEYKLWIYVNMLQYTSQEPTMLNTATTFGITVEFSFCDVLRRRCLVAVMILH